MLRSFEFFHEHEKVGNVSILCNFLCNTVLTLLTLCVCKDLFWIHPGIGTHVLESGHVHL